MRSLVVRPLRAIMPVDINILPDEVDNFSPALHPSPFEKEVEGDWFIKISLNPADQKRGELNAYVTKPSRGSQ